MRAPCLLCGVILAPCLRASVQAETQEAIHARLRAAEQRAQQLAEQNRQLEAVKDELSVQLQDALVAGQRVGAPAPACAPAQPWVMHYKLSRVALSCGHPFVLP